MSLVFCYTTIETITTNWLTLAVLPCFYPSFSFSRLYTHSLSLDTSMKVIHNDPLSQSELSLHNLTRAFKDQSMPLRTKLDSIQSQAITRLPRANKINATMPPSLGNDRQSFTPTTHGHLPSQLPLRSRGFCNHSNIITVMTHAPPQGRYLHM